MANRAGAGLGLRAFVPRVPMLDEDGKPVCYKKSGKDCNREAGPTVVWTYSIAGITASLNGVLQVDGTSYATQSTRAR